MAFIKCIHSEAFHTLPYKTASSRGIPEPKQLQFFQAYSEGLPPNISSLVLTSDLQGREIGQKNRLLGCALSGELEALHRQGVIPYPCLVAVCGDLYEYPDCHKRGGTGPVDEVFFALSSICDQVVGVLGNHDELTDPISSLPPNVSILDGETKTALGICVGGVGGVIGDPKRHLRRTEEAFLQQLESVTAAAPDLLLLHQGPDDPATFRKGDPSVRLSLETGYAGLTVFGHTRWSDSPLIHLGDGQALNVDGRVVVVTPC